MKKYTIEMTENEVNAMRSVAEHIGGQPSGPRGAVDSFASKLAKAQGDAPVMKLILPNEGTARSLYMQDRWPDLTQKAKLHLPPFGTITRDVPYLARIVEMHVNTRAGIYTLYFGNGQVDHDGIVNFELVDIVDRG